jgi:hypothetical protein
MKKIIKLIILLQIIDHIYGYAQLAVSVQPKLESNTTVKPLPPTNLENTHNITQQVVIALPPKDPSDCSHASGNKLIEQMHCQSSENFKKNLMNFNDRMARYYLMSLSAEQYYEMLQNFTEQEWKIFYDSRQKESRHLFPATLKEQKNALKRAYLETYYHNVLNVSNSVIYFFASEKIFEKTSLEDIVRAYEKECARLSGTVCSCRLNNRFYALRKTLFNRPRES